MVALGTAFVFVPAQSPVLACTLASLSLEEVGTPPSGDSPSNELGRHGRRDPYHLHNPDSDKARWVVKPYHVLAPTP